MSMSDELKNHPNAREAEDKMLADMGIIGGQGREPREIKRDAGFGGVAFWVLVVIVAIVML